MNQCGPTSGTLRKLDRCFDAFRSGVRKENVIQSATYATLKFFSKDPREERSLKLHHRWKIKRDAIGERLFNSGVVATKVADRVAAEHVEVAVTAVVENMRTLRAHITAVVTNRPENPRESRIHMFGVECCVAADVVREEAMKVKGHG